MSVAYVNLDLWVSRDGDAYIAKLESPYAQGIHRFQWAVSDEEIELFILRIGKYRGRTVRRIEQPEVKAIKEFGGMLFELVFGGAVRDTLRISQATADNEGKGIRLRLRLNECPELADVAWEFLYDKSKNRFLALATDSSIVRFLEHPTRLSSLKLAPPLKMLVVIASPTDYPPLDVEQEWSHLKTSLAPLENTGYLTIERLHQPTLAKLRYALQDGHANILHFIGHGTFDHESQDGQLLFENDRRQGHRVSGQDVGMVLYNYRSTLRLVVLNACEGARAAKTDPFAGVAQSIIQQGIPAVVAMQFEISDRAAQLLAYEFYRMVARGATIDQAVAEARNGLFSSDLGVEWGTPVLYQRDADGQVFDIDPITVSTLPVPAPIPLASVSPMEPLRSATAAPSEKSPASVILTNVTGQGAELPQTAGGSSGTPPRDLSRLPMMAGWGVAGLAILVLIYLILQNLPEEPETGNTPESTVIALTTLSPTPTGTATATPTETLERLQITPTEAVRVPTSTSAPAPLLPTPTTTSEPPTHTPEPPSPTAEPPSPTPDPPTPIPDPVVTSITVLANAGDGVAFIAPRDGSYQFLYAEGAYSAYPEGDPATPSAHWTTTIYVYRGSVVWGPHFDVPREGETPKVGDTVGVLGVRSVTDGYSSTREAAVQRAYSESTPFTLNLVAGDMITLITIDERNNYSGNQGSVTVKIAY